MNQMDLTLHEKLNTDTFGMLDTNVMVKWMHYHLSYISYSVYNSTWHQKPMEKNGERERERERGERDGPTTGTCMVVNMDH